MGREKEQLRFQQVIDPVVFGLIPRPLLEQIDGLDSTQVDDLIGAAQRTMNLVKNEQGIFSLIVNPMVYIAVLQDRQHKMHGFVWVEFDTIERLMYVQAASVARAHQGNAREAIVDHLFNLKLRGTQKAIYEFCRNKIKMATSKPKAYTKSGWKRSKMVIMEIDNVVSTDSEPGGAI